MGSMMNYDVILVDGSEINFVGLDTFFYSVKNDENCWHFPKSDGGVVLVKGHQFSHLISEPVPQPDARDARDA